MEERVGMALLGGAVAIAIAIATQTANPVQTSVSSIFIPSTPL